MEHRNHRHDGVAARNIHGLGQAAHHPVQHVGAVRIDHTFRIAGGAGGVAHAAGGILVELRPGETRIAFGDQLLIAQRIAQRGRARHVGAAGHDDEAFDRRQLVLQFPRTAARTRDR